MMAALDEEGFTLIELLISIAITIVIVSVIGSALIVFLQNGTYATERDDHSGGAIILASYLNRDLASADTVVAPGGACSGAGPGVVNRMTLQWTEWTATPADPEPVAGSETWRASYLVMADPAPVTPTRPQRYQLVRRLCPSSGAAESTLLVDNLAGSNLATAAALITVATPSGSDCSASAVRLTVPAYLSDSTGSFTYGGCLKARIR